jgi:hypothetical protein
MKILVNEDEIEITEFDNIKSIIELYSIKKKNTLPNYFHLTGEYVGDDFEEGTEISLSYIIDILENLTLVDLFDQSLSIKLSEEFNIKKEDVVILWTFDRTLSEDDLEYLKSKNTRLFSTIERLREVQIEYRDEIKRQRKYLRENVGTRDKVFKKLSKIKVSFEYEDFFLENIKSTTIILTKGDTLYDIFDAIDTSLFIPFLVLNFRGKQYYKIYKNIVPPDSWINEEYDQDGIYFKLLNSNKSKLNSKQYLLENLYSTGMCYLTSTNTCNIVIYLHLRDKTVEEVELRKKILESFGNRLEYTIISTQQTGVRGSFNIPDVVINKAIFADLILNNDLFRYFIFCNERQKTIMDKKKFYIYFKSYQNLRSKTDTSNILEMRMASSITIISTISDSDAFNTIRIGKILNLQEANSLVRVFVRLLSLYLQEYDEIFKFYDDNIKGFIKRTETKRKKTKEDKKVGKRLRMLTKHRPDIFVDGFSSQCQKKRQPFIIRKEEVEEYRERLGNSHKVMEFDGDWYVCEPREVDDKDMRNIWPGLSVNMRMPSIRDKYPFVPCCFTIDQYAKKGSYMNKMKRGEMKGAQTKDYIVSSNRMVEPDRLGFLPEASWNKIFIMSEIKKIKKKRQEFFPFLRYGVLKRPDSFFHCLEHTFNNGYSRGNIDQRIQMVNVAKKNVSNMEYLSIGKQELFDMSDETIRETLQTEDFYIDPGRYISLAQEYYKCNIIIFTISEQEPESDIVIPHTSQSYLIKTLNENRPTVFIIKYETSFGLPYPYQCEMICKVGKTGNAITFFDFTDFVDMMNKFYVNSDEIYLVDIGGYTKYKII